MTPVALTIAGSDPSGGAGIQADLKTFHRFGVYGQAVITLVTVQNTVNVRRVEVLAPDLIEQQIGAVLSDIAPHALKLGALGNAAAIEAVARSLREFDRPVVVDPVMISKHGAPLMTEAAREMLLCQIVPKSFLLTPNLHEAAALTAQSVATIADMRRSAERLRELGAKNVLVKGGHLQGDAVDVLLADTFYELRAERIDTPHTHGTGCTYSAAITAELAKGVDLVEAVRTAKEFITKAIRTNPGLGHGAGPLNHFA